jgi:uncharacterized protein YecE (DUF72 family)
MIRIGCSGWQYQHWSGEFYPAELPQSGWFAHYALSFDTVEINNSFYRLPSTSSGQKSRLWILIYYKQQFLEAKIP